MSATAESVGGYEVRGDVTPRTVKGASQNSGLLRGGMSVALFSGVNVFALYTGWQWRDAGYITAENGLGYLLGIVGGVMMMLLLLYPLRKKQVLFFRWGAVRYWFKVHMLFGVLGPLAILFHSNFSLGAINSNVALFCMLSVAVSGIVGRYFYTRIHAGLYGARDSLKEVQGRVAESRGGIANLFRAVPEAEEVMQHLERWLLRERMTLVRLIMVPWVVLRCWHARRRIVSLLSRKLHEHGLASDWSRQKIRRAQRVASRFVADYVENLRRVAEIGVYERLFSWWHVLHLPLFLMMLLAGVVHVVAVHMY